jgi:hypothetical protein
MRRLLARLGRWLSGLDKRLNEAGVVSVDPLIRDPLIRDYGKGVLPPPPPDVLLGDTPPSTDNLLRPFVPVHEVKDHIELANKIDEIREKAMRELRDTGSTGFVSEISPGIVFFGEITTTRGPDPFKGSSGEPSKEDRATRFKGRTAH